MATIEPRLIHLLNDSESSDNITNFTREPTQLPPLYSGPLKQSERAPGDTLHDVCSHYARADGKGTKDNSFSSVGHGDTQAFGSAVQNTRRHKAGPAAQTNTSYSSRRPVLDDSEPLESPAYPFSKPGEGSGLAEDGLRHKRIHDFAIKDDLIQLPQPIKKQKTASIPTAVMPPIINGLHEPPPHAAIFPPIAWHDFNEQEIDRLGLLHEFSQTVEVDPASGSSASRTDDAAGNKARKRAARPRKKWSEEETKNLLLGVHRYGVGKWTSILEDASFKFNGRSAGDLKDRFRTCCPAELRKPSIDSRSSPTHSVEPHDESKPATPVSLDNETDPDQWSLKDATENLQDNGSGPGTKTKKSRAHRKKVEDLEELGIHGPFKKSHRRARRPFTEQDDKEILEGLDRYGPAWTKIQRDPKFHLSSRQPTDLRDRVRNKYQSVYQRIEKGAFITPESSNKDRVKDDALKPSALKTSSHPFDGLQRASGPSGVNGLKRAVLEPPMDRTEQNEEVLKRPLNAHMGSDTPHALPSHDLVEVHTPHFNGGEMDISRLLLDEPKSSHVVP